MDGERHELIKKEQIHESFANQYYFCNVRKRKTIVKFRFHEVGEG
jgi:hypothetical protein